MARKLYVLYFGPNIPRKLPSKDRKKVVVVVKEPKWRLICNGQDLCNDILTYRYSQFVSATKVIGFGLYPHVCLDMDGVTLPDLLDILREMGFELVLPKNEPDFQ